MPGKTALSVRSLLKKSITLVFSKSEQVFNVVLDQSESCTDLFEGKLWKRFVDVGCYHGVPLQ